MNIVNMQVVQLSGKNLLEHHINYVCLGKLNTHIKIKMSFAAIS